MIPAGRTVMKLKRSFVALLLAVLVALPAPAQETAEETVVTLLFTNDVDSAYS